MRWLVLVLVGCNGSSTADAGPSDGSPPGMDGAAFDAATMQDTGMPDGGSGAVTCTIPEGGAMCNGLAWACDEVGDCTTQACCLELTNMNVGGSACLSFCNNPKLQLCRNNSECSGGAACTETTCSGYVVKTCGGVPANLCK